MTDQRRLAVLGEARSWLGTPYHHMARVKGVGCDCLTLLTAVYHAAGVVPEIEIPQYPPDWHLHRSAELYLTGLATYASEIEPLSLVPPSERARSRYHPRDGEEDTRRRRVQPGDVALFRFGRCFSHSAIVVEWPMVIHAWHVGGVMLSDASQPLLSGHPVRFFDPFLSPFTPSPCL